MMKINRANFSTLAIKYLPCVLILLAFIGFFSKSLYNYPVGIMAIIGFFGVLKKPGIIFEDRVMKIYTLAFLAAWLPLIISFIDAANPGHSAHTVFPYLRFYFAGIFIITALSKDKDRLAFIIAGLFYLVIFWCIDATIQFIFLKNLLGFPYQAGHITGMFYPRNTISHICSILSSFCFYYVYINKTTLHFKWLLLIPIFFVVFISGRRAAWIMLALSACGFFVYSYKFSQHKKQIIKIASMLFVSVCIVFILTLKFHDPSYNRFKITLGLFSNDYDTIDAATALRLPIWQTAFSTFKANPVNGVGPRGFRHTYRLYADPDDYWLEGRSIPSQPHLLIIEILAETGLIGFLGYLLMLYFLSILLCYVNHNESLFPYLLPVLIALFPFNAHMAFYGSIWSSMIWLLMSLYFSQAKLILNTKPPP